MRRSLISYTYMDTSCLSEFAASQLDRRGRRRAEDRIRIQTCVECDARSRSAADEPQTRTVQDIKMHHAHVINMMRVHFVAA